MSRAALTRPNGRKNILPSQVQTQAYSQVSPYQGAAAAMGVTTAVSYPMGGAAAASVTSNAGGYPYYPYPTGVIPTAADGVMTPEAMAMMYYAQYYQQQAAAVAAATGTPDLTQLSSAHIEEEVSLSPLSLSLPTSRSS
jgi:hypothetical protein